jgi:ribosomal protein S27AE
VSGPGVDAGPCPRCGAQEAKRIVYGYPAFDEVERFGHDVVYAGCLLPQVLRPWACGRCGEHYGEPLRFLGDEDD